MLTEAIEEKLLKTRVTDSSARTYLLIAALFAIPAWMMWWYWGNVSWLDGLGELYQFNRLYGPANLNQKGGYLYPYLPSFGLVNLLLAAPFHFILAALFGGESATHDFWFNRIWYVITNFWGYISLLGIAYCAGALFDDNQMQRRAVIVMLLLPGLWREVFYLGPNALVAFLAVLSLLIASQDRWFAAAVAAGLSTFKFTGIPFCIVLLIYASVRGGRDGLTKTVAGGLISQIPNIAYFALFPADILVVLERGGGLSTNANRIVGDHLWLNPLHSLGLADAYIAVGFKLAVIACALLGAYVALRSPLGLPAGYAVGYFSTAFLIPAEQRYLPFVVMAVIALLPLMEDLRMKLGVAGIHGIVGYYLMSVHFRAGTLHGPGMDWPYGAVLIEYALEFGILGVLLLGLYLAHKTPSLVQAVSHSGQQPAKAD
jgi:hypothetical protein